MYYRMKVPCLLMSVNAKSRDLFGEAFAVGWVIFEHGREVFSGIISCPYKKVKIYHKSSSVDTWILNDVLPHIPPPAVYTPVELRSVFWDCWNEVRKRGGYMLVEGIYPVESRLLLDCIRDNPDRKTEFPSPVLNLSDFMLAIGVVPNEEYDERSISETRYHPIGDARATGRRFFKIVEQLRENGDDAAH